MMKYGGTLQPGLTSVAKLEPIAGRGSWLSPIVLALTLGFAAFVDTPQRFTVGPVSGLGACTIALAGVSLMGLLACGSYPAPLLRRLATYLCFLAYLGMSLIWAPPPFWGFQNALLYVLFGALLVVAGVVAARDPAGMERQIGRGMLWIDLVGGAIVSLNLAASGLPTSTGLWWVGPRSFALLGLIPLAWHLAGWYYQRRAALLPVVIWLAAIGSTLSRTATAIAVLLVGMTLLCQLRFRFRSAGLTLVLLVVSLAVIAGLLTRPTPFRERVFSGDTSIRLGRVGINAEGRLDIWDVTVRSAMEAPILGKGVGSSQELIAATFPGNPRIDHPHNDYFRLWHDLGLVGVSMFVVAVSRWLFLLVRAWYVRERDRRAGGQLQLAGALSLLGTMLAMITDNVIIYVFAMGPVAILVGAGLGALERPDAQYRQ